MHSMPSQRVNTVGYLAGSPTNFSVAPSERCRLTLLLSTTGPARNTPGGTTTRPPPRAAPAACCRAGGDGPCDRFRGLSLAVGDGPKLGNREVALRKGGGLDAGQH